MKPALCVLAAGASRRLGTCKATVRLGGRAALDRLLTAGAGLDDGPALVVTGADDAAIRAHLAALDAPTRPDVMTNARWRAGRTGSVACAVRARPGRDLCLAPVDVPLVGRAVFAALARAWAEAGAPERGWLAPAVELGGEDRFGHPVVLGRVLVETISTWDPQRALRDLRREAQPLLRVDVEDPAILDDLDTPSDLRTLNERFEAH